MNVMIRVKKNNNNNKGLEEEAQREERKSQMSYEVDEHQTEMAA